MHRGTVTVVKQGLSAIERRETHKERRCNQAKAAINSFYRNRRKHLRRENDDVTGVYVDAHEPKLWYLAITLMTLSVLDAFFTTLLLANGSEELNPLLAYLLQIDLWVFLAVKFFITGASIVFFILHKHHRLLNTVNCYHLLVFSVAVYFILICYELSMVRHLIII